MAALHICIHILMTVAPRLLVLLKKFRISLKSREEELSTHIRDITVDSVSQAAAVHSRASIGTANRESKEDSINRFFEKCSDVYTHELTIFVSGNVKKEKGAREFFHLIFFFFGDYFIAKTTKYFQAA